MTSDERSTAPDHSFDLLTAILRRITPIRWTGDTTAVYEINAVCFEGEWVYTEQGARLARLSWESHTWGRGTEA